MEYGGSLALDPPSPEDEVNIMTALKHHGRISSISLTVTRSLLERFYEIKGPFTKLEHLVLQSQDGVQLTLPSTFQWGPRLLSLHLTGISPLGLPELLYSSMCIVDIHLHEMPGIGCFTPKSLLNALSRMTQLQSLSLRLLPNTAFIVVPHSPGPHTVLPTLTCLKYQGTSECLNDFLTMIDAPRLADIEITFYDETLFAFSHLPESRMEMQTSHRRSDIIFSENSVSISLTQSASTSFKLQVICEPFSRRLSSLADFCTRFSAFLYFVEDLHICVTSTTSGQTDSDREEWLKLIHAFGGTKWFHLAGNSKFTTEIALALQLSETVLPSLHKLCIQEPVSHYAPLREAVVLFMHARLLSCHFIGVEYERQKRPFNQLGTLFVYCLFKPPTDVFGEGHVSQQITTKILNDDTLLNIFRHYLHRSSRFWPTLTHVCQRWRRIILGLPLGLDLRIFCSYGMPVSKSLDCWPPFPLVVNYGGSPILESPAPEDEDDIMAALNQFDRVRSISLTVTNSLLEKLSTISEPFSELAELVLLSQDNVRLTLPSAFRSGQLFRTLHLTQIAIPTLPRLISPATGLVDIQLHEIPSVGYFSPEAFTNALSGMTQLQSLSLHFHSFPPRRSYLNSPPHPTQRASLPALSRLKYRGTSKYLDTFVARIDTPRLSDIDISFFYQPTMDAAHLGKFIERIGIQTLLSQADIFTSANIASISFSEPGARLRLAVQISCAHVDWQLSSMAQICNHFSRVLSHVKDLGISSTQPPSGTDDMDRVQWAEIIRTFNGTGVFRAAGTLAADILCTLSLAVGETNVLPALHTLHVPELGPEHVALRKVAESFATSRRLSGHLVEVHPHTLIPDPDWTHSCEACGKRFSRPQELARHRRDKHELVRHHRDKHEPSKVCPYCGIFRWSRRYIFRRHLEVAHPELAHTYSTVSNTAS